jgi:hypothetical protein
MQKEEPINMCFFASTVPAVDDAVIALSYRHVPKLSSEPPLELPTLNPCCCHLNTHSASSALTRPGTRLTRVASLQRTASFPNKRSHPRLRSQGRTALGKVTGACRLSAPQAHPTSCQPRLHFLFPKLRQPLERIPTVSPTHNPRSGPAAGLSPPRLRPVTDTTALIVIRISHNGPLI